MKPERMWRGANRTSVLGGGKARSLHDMLALRSSPGAVYTPNARPSCRPFYVSIVIRISVAKQSYRNTLYEICTCPEVFPQH